MFDPNGYRKPRGRVQIIACVQKCYAPDDCLELSSQQFAIR